MRSFKKPLITVLLGIFVFPLLLSGVLYFWWWLDADHQQLKGHLQVWFKQQTAHDLLISGPLQLSLLPSFRLSTGPASITDASQDKILQLESLSVAADPFSLITGEMKFDEVIIDRAKLKLIRTSQGEIRFFSAEESKGPSKKTAALPVELPFQSIELRNSQLELIEQKNDKRFELSGIDLSLKPIGESLYQLELDSALTASTGLDLKLSMSCQLQIDSLLEVTHLDSRFNMSRNDQAIDLQVSGHFNYALTDNHVHSGKLLLKSQVMNLDAILVSPAMPEKLQVSIKSFNPASLIRFTGLLGDTVLSGQVMQNASGDMHLAIKPRQSAVQIDSLMIDQTQMQGNFEWRRQQLKMRLKLDELELVRYRPVLKYLLTGDTLFQELIASVHINRIKLEHGMIEQFMSRLEFEQDGRLTLEGSMHAKQINPSKLYQDFYQLLSIQPEYSLQMQDDLLSYLDGQLAYRYSETDIAFTGLDLRLDETTVEGDISYNYPLPQLTANLAVGHVDADRYLQLLPQQPATVSEKHGQDDQALSGLLDWLKTVQGQGEVQVDSLKYKGTLYRGISLQFDSE